VRRSGDTSPPTRVKRNHPEVCLGLAVEQGLELLALDRLALEQQLGDRRQLLAVLGQDLLRLLVRALNDPADLVVDLARRLVRELGPG
jgi:hypothetical protein